MEHCFVCFSFWVPKCIVGFIYIMAQWCSSNKSQLPFTTSDLKKKKIDVLRSTIESNIIHTFFYAIAAKPLERMIKLSIQ